MQTDMCCPVMVGTICVTNNLVGTLHDAKTGYDRLQKAAETNTLHHLASRLPAWRMITEPCGLHQIAKLLSSFRAPLLLRRIIARGPSVPVSGCMWHK